MSISTARAAVYSLLTASGPYSTTEVSGCDFGIVETVAASGIVFVPEGEAEIQQLAFAGPGNSGAQAITWRFRGDLFVKYKGNSPSYLSQMYQAIDDVQQTFAKSEKGQGSNTASILRLTSIVCNIAEMWEIGGHDFGAVRFYFQEEEIDPGQ